MEDAIPGKKAEKGDGEEEEPLMLTLGLWCMDGGLLEM